MSDPRHLWSGDWREESDAAADRLARRRGAAEDQPEPPPESAPRQPPRQRSATVRAGRGPQHRATVLIVLATLLSAGAAYAVVSLLVGSGGGSPAVASGAPAWLGVGTTSFPLGAGALITDVSPGGPAATAGLLPGDVITQIGTRPVATPADVQSALAGMQAGERVEIQYQRGPIPSTTKVTLAARPPNP